MSKSVLVSVSPEECARIFRIIGKTETGEDIYMKSPLLKKTRPKLDTPFRCYIYCTKEDLLWVPHNNGQELYEGQGKVIGEFVCDSIEEVIPKEYPFSVGKSKPIYFWRISNLKIYEEPKELVIFCKPCDRDPDCDCRYCVAHGRSMSKWITHPQSWCYVESLHWSYTED